MEIHLPNLKDKISKLDNLKNDYETVLINYYNSTKEIEENWNNTNAKLLLSFIVEEQKDTKKIQNNIEDINNLYKYIYEKYSAIGKSIKINLEKKEEITDKINTCINQLTKIIDSYKNMDKNKFAPHELEVISNEEMILKEELEKLNKIKTSVKKNYNLVEKIENEIKSKASKINIDFINEIDISKAIEK